jgi:hypothetical protein
MRSESWKAGSLYRQAAADILAGATGHSGPISGHFKRASETSGLPVQARWDGTGAQRAPDGHILCDRVAGDGDQQRSELDQRPEMRFAFPINSSISRSASAQSSTSCPGAKLRFSAR